jgi:hypothetical protein
MTRRRSLDPFAQVVRRLRSCVTGSPGSMRSAVLSSAVKNQAALEPRRGGDGRSPTRGSWVPGCPGCSDQFEPWRSSCCFGPTHEVSRVSWPTFGRTGRVGSRMRCKDSVTLSDRPPRGCTTTSTSPRRRTIKRLSRRWCIDSGCTGAGAMAAGRRSMFGFSHHPPAGAPRQRASRQPFARLSCQRVNDCEQLCPAARRASRSGVGGNTLDVDRTDGRMGRGR